MQHLEGIGTHLLYMGRTVLKGCLIQCTDKSSYFLYGILVFNP